MTGSVYMNKRLHLLHLLIFHLLKQATDEVTFSLREQTRKCLAEAMMWHLANRAVPCCSFWWICACQTSWSPESSRLQQTVTAMFQPFDVVTVLTDRINRLSAMAGAEGGEQVLLWWESRGVCGDRSRLQMILLCCQQDSHSCRSQEHSSFPN